MRLLLDTHAALWLALGDQRLGPAARSHLQDDANEVLVSAVVAWEIAIKRSAGKLTAPDGLVSGLIGMGARALPITVEHADGVGALPWHHRDPFDRLLIAQAKQEHTPIVTIDGVFADYGVPVIW